MTDVLSLLRECLREGAVVEKTNGGHWKITCPDGIVFISSTPGDRRAYQNARANLRKHGLVLP